MEKNRTFSDGICSEKCEVFDHMREFRRKSFYLLKLKSTLYIFKLSGVGFEETTAFALLVDSAVLMLFVCRPAHSFWQLCNREELNGIYARWRFRQYRRWTRR